MCIRDRVQEIARERSSRFWGTVQEVLVESVNDQDASLVPGRMGNNLLVHFPGDASMIGTFKQIHLDVCKGFYLSLIHISAGNLSTR